MSHMTNYGENKLIDFFRGQGWSLPADWHVGLLSAYSDSSVTEITGTSYARQAVTRSLANWSGTQGSGTTLASSGTSHRSTNNVAVNFGTAGSAWGTVVAVALFDASTGGNCVWVAPLVASVTIATSDPVNFPANTIGFTLGLVGGFSDYLSNVMIDLILRGQSFTFPATTYVALCTSAPTNAGGGSEPSGGDYARVAITTNMTNWAGTQSAGSVVASSGTGGITSNNSSVAFPTPTASWGTIVARKIMDAASGGNLLFYATMSPRSVGATSLPPTYAAGAMRIRAA